MSDQMQRTRKHLAFMTGHDQMLALQLAVSTFIAFPFVVLCVPFVNFLFEATFRPRLTLTERTALQDRFNIPRTLLLRRNDKAECHVYSIPFFSILYLNKQVLSNLDNQINHGIIQHELGHHGRNDATVLVWLRFSLAFWVLMALFFAMYIFVIAAGNDFDFEGFEPLPPITLDFGFYMSAASAITAIILLTHYTYAHRREFVADNYAFEQDANALSAFLRFGRWKPAPKRRFGFLSRIPLFQTHPTFIARENTLEGGFRPTPLKTFWLPFQWTVFTILLFSISNLAILPIVFTREELELVVPLGPGLVFGLAVACCGVFLSRAAEVRYEKHSFFGWTAAGYAVGGCASFSTVALVNYQSSQWNSYYQFHEGVVLFVSIVPLFVLATATSVRFARKLGLPHLCSGLSALSVFHMLTYTLAFMTIPEANDLDYDLEFGPAIIIWSMGAIAALALGLITTLCQKMVIWSFLFIYRRLAPSFLRGRQ